MAVLAALVTSNPSWAATGTTFSYTGNEESYTVPPGYSLVEISALGGGGRGWTGAARGGHGATVTAVVAVAPGDILKVRVGGGGQAVGSGGSATAVVTASGGALVVAGGGGASSIQGNYPGGNGGGNGANGTSMIAGRYGRGGNGSTGAGGLGGDLCCGGSAGAGGSATPTSGADGQAGAGDPGGLSAFFGRNGTANDPTTAAYAGGGGAGFGGGGGGYSSGGGGYGGGGGAGDSAASSGGGGSYALVANGFTPAFSVGSNGGPPLGLGVGNGAGDGSVTITPYTPPNSPPTATNVGMSGTARQGSLLTGAYNYADADNDPEGTSTFRWIRNNVSTGVAGGTTVAATPTYTAAAADVGNYLYFCVTPVASANVPTGTEECSSASAQVQPPLPVNGTCGSAAGQSFTLKPTADLCATGVAGAVTSSAGLYSWTCQGTDSGTDSGVCTANWAATGGSGNASVTAPAPASNNNWVLNNASVSATTPAPAPQGTTFPMGTTSLQLTTGDQGSSATVTIQYSQPVPAGAVYMKYGKSPDGYNCSAAACAVDHWYQMPANQAVFSQDRRSVTLTIQDGGVGDNDLTANSSITDPGGPAVIASLGPQAIPTLSEWGAIVLASLMALWGLSTLRRRTD